ncbi:HEAT repeat domain-containing protein [Siminovitchia sp. FSL W7-1587]|uniref:HEAT repeat domain-containing protein n=1 Tax=Siminovitchia sp. FSL W7-1587 TaxID=2954699 RepID=UPI0030D1D2EB
MMDVSIDLLIQFMLVVSVFLLVFSIYLLSNRAMEVARERKKAAYIKEHQDAWYHYVRGSGPFPESLMPRNTYELYGVEQIFLSYIKNVSDPLIREKIKLFSNESMKDHYGKLLANRKWSIRMNALYRVVDFHIDSLIDHCISMEKKKLSPDEQFQLLKIYSLFKPDLFLKKFLEKPPLFSEYECKKLFKTADDSVLKQLIKNFHQLSSTCKYAFINTLGMKREIGTVPFLESLLKEEDAEIRIRSLKAIHEIGTLHQIEKYTPFISSEIWEERLMAAKVLGNLPLRDSVPYLETLLADEAWRVRQEAAKTLKMDPHTIMLEREQQVY